MRTLIIVSLIAYLCGSIPFGYILVRIVKGKDIRESGSGNIGATNVARTAPVLGIATLLLDGAKGFLAVAIPSFWLFSVEYRSSAGHEAYYQAAFTANCLAALFAIIGHVFPLWLGFRGGKGVATAVGAFLGVSPSALGIVFLVFIMVLALTRYVSLSSIIAALLFPFVCYFLSRDSVYFSWTAFLLIVISSGLIIAKHHANIRRLVAGTENRFGKSKVAALAKED